MSHAEHGAPSSRYLLFSVACQQALAASLFGGASLFGWQAVVVSGGLVAVACVGIGALPRRCLEAVGQHCMRWRGSGRHCSGRCRCRRARWRQSTAGSLHEELLGSVTLSDRNLAREGVAAEG